MQSFNGNITLKSSKYRQNNKGYKMHACLKPPDTQHELVQKVLL